MTTNIIREPLIRYSQQQCEYHGIPTADVDSGPLWNAKSRDWYSQFEQLPVTSYGKLLLVPKAIVRHHQIYDAGEYYRNYLLQYLRESELNANSSLVELLKNKRRRVTSKALMAKYGRGKETIVRESLKHPEVLDRYRKSKEDKPFDPLSHEDIADIEKQQRPDWDALLTAVTSLSPGDAASVAYEKAVEALLTALFYPLMTNPVAQHKIHGGRKRIDISYTNMATTGFFGWLARSHPASHVFVECKNYGSDVGNPALDQLAGRFSPSRGKFGLLVCRQFQDKALFFKRCHDTAGDDRGFVIPLDDADLASLVQARKEDPSFANLPLLQQRFSDLVS